MWMLPSGTPIRSALARAGSTSSPCPRSAVNVITSAS